MQDINWDDLKFVLAVARSNNLASASRLLQVNESTVARRIVRIEKNLKAQLFERTTGSLRLTKAGELAFDYAEQVEMNTQHLFGAIEGSDLKAQGTVRLTSVPVILNHLLIPCLQDFTNKHPQLNLELIAEPRDLSLSKREVDIALRLARPTKEYRIIAQRVGRLNYAIYGKKQQQHQQTPWINYEHNMRDLPQAKWIADKCKKSQIESTIMVNDTESVLACLKAGLGKSLLPVFVGDKQQSLERLDEQVTLSRELWLMIHPELRHLVRMKIVTQWLKERLEQLP